MNTLFPIYVKLDQIQTLTGWRRPGRLRKTTGHPTEFTTSKGSGGC